MSKEEMPGGMEAPLAEIRLELFRHDAKAKPAEGQADETVRLTEEGRVHATKAGREKSPRADMSVAIGSPRERSVETAMRHMMAEHSLVGREGEDTLATNSLEGMRAEVAASFDTEPGDRIWKKDRMTSKLNFVWDGTPGFKEVAYKKYEEKEALKFLAEDSDALALKLKDETSTSYSRQAGNVAELIQGYLTALPNLRRVIDENPDKYPEGNREMQRWLGSHQTVTESFLMKVIEKTEGRGALMEFIESLPDKNGFGFSEGYTVNLKIMPGGESAVALKYKDREWTITPEIIQEIIDERDNLNRLVAPEEENEKTA